MFSFSFSFSFSFFLFHWKFETYYFNHFSVIQPKSSITVKQASDLIKGVNLPLNITLITTAFEIFDETEMFAIVMEPEPGGELLDKVVKMC